MTTIFSLFYLFFRLDRCELKSHLFGRGCLNLAVPAEKREMKNDLCVYSFEILNKSPAICRSYSKVTISKDINQVLNLHVSIAIQVCLNNLSVGYIRYIYTFHLKEKIKVKCPFQFLQPFYRKLCFSLLNLLSNTTSKKLPFHLVRNTISHLL